MNYGQVKKASLQLIFSESIAGTPILSTYNNQADYEGMIPTLVNDCMMYIATTVKKIPAIVPLDLFNRVQEKLAVNKKAPARHKAEDDYLLTTKIFCGYCGAYLCGESGTGRNGVHHYYKCVSVKKSAPIASASLYVKSGLKTLF